MIYPDAFLEFCSTTSHKLTSLRKHILYILWSANKPLKAYEILDQLLQTMSNAKPPTVYRVLDYFVVNGLVHKIESIQSYTLCQEPDKQYASEILMVCDSCHGVLEVYDETLHGLLKRLSTNRQFALGADTIELKGICHLCQS
ncbi:Fur family transcriptional regulator [Legionella spiritensis]|nr:transcriptional repressor [Legionella spiritensis]VEG91874.1 transcriptional regulator np20, Fur family [Legionella spiritensis]